MFLQERVICRKASLVITVKRNIHRALLKSLDKGIERVGHDEIQQIDGTNSLISAMLACVHACVCMCMHFVSNY